MMASSSVERIVLVWPDSGSVPYIVENPYHGPCQKSTLCTGTAVVYQYISVVSVYKRPLRYIKPSVRDIALDQVYSPSYYLFRVFYACFPICFRLVYLIIGRLCTPGMCVQWLISDYNVSIFPTCSLLPSRFIGPSVFCFHGGIMAIWYIVMTISNGKHNNKNNGHGIPC